jgi:hypothetical protein
MRKLIVLFFLTAFTVSVGAQSFKGFFRATVSKEVLTPQIALKSIGKPVILFRPAVNVGFLEITKSSIPGTTFDTKSLQKGGVGISMAFFNGTENNFSINALALMPLDYNGSTQLFVSPAIAIQGLQFLSLGIGRDTELHRWFGMLGISYNFNTVK